MAALIKELTLMLAVAWSSVTPANAQEFVVTTTKVNPVMRPKNVTDAMVDCANSAVCRSVVEAGAAYLGVPRGTVSAALASVPRAQRSGEEGRYAIRLPRGYEYCRSRIRTISVVPATGDRASVMSARSSK